ncbi:hypothetical protein SAMN05720606_101334 [Paenibacillus polysaccharolyticus]|uniref:Butirosin biosynthesis protein H, N-terminal n=1 Tax=Paenibacillus polysaccharolyticus TaxID=582692 RepID=A0A1G5BDX0_9BACL|nr:hypothetical protein [Paenibacillus polysaccharolyticus]SCX88382.1 hypothetical protein SAMN05720606_101334 [Paenibacillus polysaccharolyticus]
MQYSLPIYQPFITGRLHHSLPQSIMSKNDSYIAWFYNNYIQISCNREKSGSSELNFFRYFMWEHRYPFFHIEQLTRDTISLLNINFINLIKDTLKDGKYFYLNIDEFYLPLQHHQQFHIVRDVLIFGFNDDENIFKVLGFDKNGKFGVNDIPYHVLYEAYMKTEVVDGWEGYVYIVKENKFDYQFNFELIFELFEDYLHSKNTSKKFNMIENDKNLIFGINCIESLKEDIIQNDFSFVPIHILWEHKKIMVNRINYISSLLPELELHKFATEYEELEKYSSLIRMLCIKKYYNDSLIINDKLIDLLNSIITKEMSIIPRFLEKMKCLNIQERYDDMLIKK